MDKQVSDWTARVLPLLEELNISHVKIIEGDDAMIVIGTPELILELAKVAVADGAVAC